MVNAPDPKVRENRLSMLAPLDAEIVDFAEEVFVRHCPGDGRYRQRKDEQLQQALSGDGVHVHAETV